MRTARGLPCPVRFAGLTRSTQSEVHNDQIVQTKAGLTTGHSVTLHDRDNLLGTSCVVSENVVWKPDHDFTKISSVTRKIALLTKTVQKICDQKGMDENRDDISTG